MIKIYTMDGCPYCEELKSLLDKEGLEYTEIDINQDEHKEECDLVFELTKCDSVPIARVDRQLFAPDVSFTSIDDCFYLIKKFSKS